MKRLNILDLHRKIHQQSSKTTACFERVLDLCHRKIVFLSDKKHMRFFFEVPEYLFGYPLFDMNDAIKYVIEALTQNGFLAVYYFPKFIYVSWDLTEIDNYKQQNKRLKTSVDRGLDFKYKSSGKLSLDID